MNDQTNEARKRILVLVESECDKLPKPDLHELIEYLHNHFEDKHLALDLALEGKS